MSYAFTFLEGIFAFISPCILPMLPVFLAYLGADEKQSLNKRFFNTLFFVLGFTTVFILLGATVFSISSFFNSYRELINRLAGVVMVFMGFVYLDFISLPNFNKNTTIKGGNFLRNYLFGISYSLAWTPCIGAFLGSAMALASTSETVYQGILLLLCFSLGLGLPFMIFSLLYTKLTNVLTLLKKYSNVIKYIGGAILIIVGLLMVFNLTDYYYAIFL